MGWRGGLRGTAEAGQSGEWLGCVESAGADRSEGERVRWAARVDRGGVLDRDGV